MAFNNYDENFNTASTGNYFKEGYVNTDTGDWATGSDILIERTKKEILNKDIQEELKMAVRSVLNQKIREQIDEELKEIRKQFEKIKYEIIDMETKCANQLGDCLKETNNMSNKVKNSIAQITECEQRIVDRIFRFENLDLNNE